MRRSELIARLNGLRHELEYGNVKDDDNWNLETVEACLFYSYFWRLRGQTLGMQVWKIKLVSPSLQTLSWQECFARLFFALVSVSMLGLGFIWMLFDPDRLTWHDRASGTRVVLLRKEDI